ncbi:MAG: carbonate dehydratase [Gammaproteobacteria bacterium]|nr:MAG: carbonate dehydratase [Gammaproteobacteria bacterium]
MKVLEKLFENNKKWAESVKCEDPDFFKRLSEQQKPEYLWIGCSDSRVPANEIVGMMPGEVFVHRNIANQVIHTDINCLSVIQYAVDVLKVKHIIVCGHYGCGGIRAAMDDKEHGLIDNWLRNVSDVYKKHRAEVDNIESEELKTRRMCELNVIEQVINVCETTVVRNAWKRGQELAIHGWVYGLEDGILKDLNMCVTAPEDLLQY